VANYAICQTELFPIMDLLGSGVNVSVRASIPPAPVCWWWCQWTTVTPTHTCHTHQ